MKKLSILFAALLVSVSSMFAAERVAYELTPTATSNNSYAKSENATIGGVQWNVTGNSSLTPWRIGGKALTNVDRMVYSKTAISEDITSIEVYHGNLSKNTLTVNSLKLVVSDAANASGDTLVGTFKANDTVRFVRPESKSWANKYYKLIYNVTNTTNSNQYLQFIGAKFFAAPIAATGISLDQSTLTLDKGAKTQLTATLTPADATTEVVWASDNTAAATVKDGLVTAVAVGKANITATVTPAEGTTYTATCAVNVVAAPDAPTFGVADDFFEGSMSVSLAAAEGMKIYYTTNGDEPTTASTLYSAPFKITATTTVKAIAYDENITKSSVVASKTYTKALTCAEANAAVDDTKMMLNTVTVVYVNGSNIYVADATGGALVYASDYGLTAGKVVKGLKGTIDIYNKLPEIKPTSALADLSITEGTVPEPTALTAVPTMDNINQYVRINGVTTTAATWKSSDSYSSDRTMTAKLGDDDITLYNTFKIDQTFEAGNYNIIGFVNCYSTTVQIAVVSVERVYDITATANDETMGTVKGAGSYVKDTEATLTATATKGYRFIGWSNGETANPLKVTVTKDEDITANFQDAINTFAYGLASSYDSTTKELTVDYALNNNATSVKIVIMNGEAVAKTVDCTGITKGQHQEVISVSDLAKDVKYTWKVEITDYVTTQVAEGRNYSFYHPSSVDIDNNPESENFGRIICNEGMQVSKSKTGYVSSGFGAGIFAFTPEFELIKNGENPGFNGGNTFTEKNASGKTAYAPRRIRISEDGRIFVTSLDVTGTYLWEINPNNLDAWTPVFSGTLNEKYELVDANNNFVAAPNAGFDVRGKGENLKLLMLSSNKDGFAYSVNGFRCAEYNLGTATTWNTTYSRLVFDAKYAVSPIGSQVQYDAEGGVWFISHRATTTETEPGLVHLTADGVEDYKELRDNTKGAGFRFNHDFSKVIIATNGKIGTIYAVSKDASGKPVLTEESQIDMKTVGNNINDFAWDYANNIYALGNSSEKIVVYAMPHTADAVVSTPAASKYAFTISDKTTFIDNTAIEAAQTQKIVRDGQVLIIRDGKTYNMMGQVVE